MHDPCPCLTLLCFSYRSVANGKVYTMGSSRNGRLGHGETHGVVKFPVDESGIRYIACGSDFTLAIGESGEKLYGWGLGIYGKTTLVSLMQ